MSCNHTNALVLGREETGGRRFPMRWCQDCGAISLDTSDRAASGWLLPRTRAEGIPGNLVTPAEAGGYLEELVNRCEWILILHGDGPSVNCEVGGVNYRAEATFIGEALEEIISEMTPDGPSRKVEGA